MTRLAIFDMNETTLDLAPVRAAVDELVPEAGGFAVWFQRLLLLSMTVTATGQRSDFAVLARSALDAVAGTAGRRIEADGFERFSAAMASIEPYPDVAPGLDRLREQGWSTIALTNSSQPAVEAQVARSELGERFDHVISVDQVGAFKPAATPYLHAARTAGVEPSEAWMVACHDWDLAGARSVGMNTAFIERSGMSYADVFPPPEVSVADFVELAAALAPA